MLADDGLCGDGDGLQLGLGSMSNPNPRRAPGPASNSQLGKASCNVM
jgi:hypothetical protein